MKTHLRFFFQKSLVYFQHFYDLNNDKFYEIFKQPKRFYCKPNDCKFVFFVSFLEITFNQFFSKMQSDNSKKTCNVITMQPDSNNTNTSQLRSIPVVFYFIWSCLNICTSGMFGIIALIFSILLMRDVRAGRLTRAQSTETKLFIVNIIGSSFGAALWLIDLYLNYSME
jgi:hypothetical protein